MFNESTLPDGKSGLRASELKYRALFENMSEGVALHELVRDEHQQVVDYRILDVNPAYERHSGLTRDVVIGQLASLVYGADYPPYIEIYKGVSLTGEPCQFETYFAPLDKHFIISAVSSSPGLFYTVFLDISRQKKIEEALRISEERLASIFNSVNDSIFIHDAQSGAILDVNERACELFGYTRDEILLMTIGDISENIPPYTIAEALDHIRRAAAGEPQLFQWRTRHRDGQLFWTEINMRLARIGEQDRVIVTGRVIDDRKQAEAERLELERRLLHAQKLESLGVLAGGIAHDFNNLLLAISGNLELALQTISPSSEALVNIKQSLHATRQAADLTRQMLAYSGKGKFLERPINLSLLVQENLHLLRACTARTVTIDLKLDPDLPDLSGDPGQLQQVVMNLITNASEAIGEAIGVIRLATGRMINNQQDDDLPPGDYVYFDVIDSGDGMTEQTREKIFEPFFTTKFTGRGLGMAAVLGIVRSHHGRITIESAVGCGTKIRVLFPALAPSARLGCVIAPASLVTGTKKINTVLVVDDEEMIRRLLEQVIITMGHQALVAADGRKALEIYQQQGEDIDLVLMDLTMPRLDGKKTFHALKRINPGVQVIMMSGFGEDAAMNQFIGMGIRGFIQKPCLVKDIIQKVEEALGD